MFAGFIVDIRRDVEFRLDVLPLGHDLAHVRRRYIAIVIGLKKIHEILLGAIRACNQADKLPRKVAIATNVRQKIDNTRHHFLLC
jgi:hypothetical protein